MKYKMSIEIEADQFLPPDQIPEGVISDGKPRSGGVSYYIRTTEGAQYLREGDYIIRAPDGNKVVGKEAFEAIYTES